MADYIYGGANLRAREGAIIGREKLFRLSECRTPDAAYAVLSEYGVAIKRQADGMFTDREETLLGILKDAYLAVEELAPDSRVLALWRYPYDCNNVKAAIKCFFRRIDPTPMLFDFGTVKCDRVVQMTADGSFSELPQAMCAAAGEAMESFAKTRDPQQVDLILDRACYADMTAAAKKSGNAFVIRLVRTKIDLCNLLITLRICRMESGSAGKSLLENALLPGGSVPCEGWSFAAGIGEASVMHLIKQTPAFELYEQLSPSLSLATLERMTDNAWMELVKESKFMPIGLEGMVSYLIAHEYEVKNLRILLASIEAGLDAGAIRERMRESYV